jgi:hypothetical protein
MVAGQLGFSKLVGIAPGADLVMATDTRGDRQFQMMSYCASEDARVMLHEYAPWVGYHLDGSSSVEKLIDEQNADHEISTRALHDLATVIYPRDPEDDLAFRFTDTLDQRMLQVMRMLGHHPTKAFQHLVDGLMKLGLARVASDDFGKDGLEFFIDAVHGAAS